MRLIIQRVQKASVAKVETNEIVGRIDKGLFILFGVKKADTVKQAEVLAEKVIKLRIMADDKDKMNFSIKDVESQILVVSQFTLYANTKDGNRPSFIDAALPDDAVKIYEHFIQKLKSLGVKVETGSFGDYMKIDCVLDGPVTIILEN
ncbi:MAG: D-tyrosyl-tRNA(Tyr) deacylase [Candidatus Woesebacteria bacterium]|nr:MAG: D-tyrosyl-tRNA(Tyr) deacylase [Candidatus Woesebacteria bacterium]